MNPMELVTAVSEHILVLRLKFTFGFIFLIAVYPSTDVCKLGVKERFYSKVASMMDSCPWRDICIILGDFSAVTGCDRAG